MPLASPRADIINGSEIDSVNSAGAACLESTAWEIKSEVDGDGGAQHSTWRIQHPCLTRSLACPALPTVVHTLSPSGAGGDGDGECNTKNGTRKQGIISRKGHDLTKEQVTSLFLCLLLGGCNCLCNRKELGLLEGQWAKPPSKLLFPNPH